MSKKMPLARSPIQNQSLSVWLLSEDGVSDSFATSQCRIIQKRTGAAAGKEQPGTNKQGGIPTQEFKVIKGNQQK